VAAGHSVDGDPACWQAGLEELLGQVAGRFGRVEPRQRARAFVWGLLADLPRKNCWTLAEDAGNPSPDGMPAPAGRGVWDHDKVCDDVRDDVVEHLGAPRRCWWWTRPGVRHEALRSVWSERSTIGHRTDRLTLETGRALG
jgi:hypothetical protein